MEPAADKECDKSHWSEKGKRKETGNGVKEKKGITRQLGERKKSAMIKRAKKEKW